MVLCHILLDRPWQDGCRILEQFMMVTKIPSLSTKIMWRLFLILPVRSYLLNLTIRGMWVASPLCNLWKTPLKEEKYMSWVGKEVSKGGNLRYEIIPLMNEFGDSFPNDLYPWVFHPWEIYATDIVVGVGLSNWSAHGTTPKEHEELNQQVSELLECGYIRESMSCCTVSALLTPRKWVMKNVHQQ